MIAKSELSQLTSVCDSVNHSFDILPTGYVVCEKDYQDKSGILSYDLQTIYLYPNPSSDNFIMDNRTDSDLIVTVYDISGRKMEVLTDIKPDMIVKFGVNYLPGIYLARITGTDGYTKVLKIIKK